MASVPSVDRWCNIPKITGPMDLAIPKLAHLKVNNPHNYKREFDQFCEFLVQHPLAKKHNKNMNALAQHMRMNINQYLKGLPFQH